MNLDNLKELWNNDQDDNIPEISLEKQSEVRSPMQKLKMNMQTEFWLIIITLPTLLWDVTLETEDDSVKYISIFTVSLVFLVMVYFYSKFLKLYKMLSHDTINTNYDLFNLRTQLLVSKEIYTSYLISYIPLAFVLSLIKINFHLDDKYNIIVFGISFFIAVLIIFFFIRYWLYYMYGRYINEVVLLVDELNGVEVKHKKDNNRLSKFEKTERFFLKKIGMWGSILNIILWFFIYYILIILCMSIIIVLVTFIGVWCDFINFEIMMKTLDRL